MAEEKQTLIHIADNKTDEILDFIPESDFWNDVRKRALTDNRDTFDFETFATESYSGAIEERNRIIIPNKHDESYSEFIIEEAAQIMDDAGLHYKAAYTVASYLELRKQKQIPAQTVNAQSAEQHVDFALDGTEWQKGDIAYSENHTTVLTAYMDAYSYLMNIASWSGLELRFRVEHDGTKVTGRYVDLVERTGTWNGHEAVFGKDLLNIERRRKFDNIVTALIGIGPENDDGSPREEAYVESDAALARWGREGRHLVEVFEPQSEDQNINPEKLLQLTQEELNRRISHQSEYVATMHTLAESLDADVKEIQFGDVIRIKDEEFYPPIYLEARIHEMEESIKRYGDSQVTLGDFSEFSENEIKSILARLKASLSDKVNNAQLVEAIEGVDITTKITQPTPPSDTSVLWVDNSNRPLVTKIYLGAVDGWVPIMPSTAEEIGADPAGSADAALAAARADIFEVNDQLTVLRNEYDDFIEDGFISRSEALSIERHLAALTAEKADLDADYTVTYADAKLTGTPKTDLQSTKTAYNSAHASLISAINTAIADSYVTAAEKTSVNNAFTSYSNALGAYSTARANAGKEITVKSSADAKAEAISAAAADATSKANSAQTAATNAAKAESDLAEARAKAYADGVVDAEEQARIDALATEAATLRTEATNKANAAQAAAQTYADGIVADLAVEVGELDAALTNFEGTVNTTFKDGIIEQAEAKAIEKYKNTLDAEKLDLDNRYTKIYADTALTGTPKTNLASAKTAYGTAHTNLINSINSAIADGKTTSTEKADVDAKFTSYRSALGTLVTRFEEAIAALTGAKDATVASNAASDATSKANAAQAAAIAAAATDAQNKANAAQTAAINAANAKAEAEREVAKAYADGIVDDEEAARIAAAQAAATAAQNDATAKADAAQSAAQAHADAVAFAAESAALLYAEAQAEFAKQEAIAYADGVITDEEAARIQDVQTRLDEAKAHAELTAQNAVDAIDFSGLATKDDLQAETDVIRDQLSSRGGANLLRNSIGYAGMDFWQYTTANTNVQTVMNEALASMGFGCGFFFPADGTSKGISQTINLVAGETYTLGWYTQRASAGSFTIDILQDTTVIASTTDSSAVGGGYVGSYLTFSPTTQSVTVRFTASGTTEITLTGVMLGIGDLPTQWTLATGELYNAYVRVDDSGLLVLGLDDDGNIESKTVMSPTEFAGYYDENRDGNFERVFWLNKDETVTKKLRALDEITMGSIKIVRVTSAYNRGWAFVPIVPET